MSIELQALMKDAVMRQKSAGGNEREDFAAVLTMYDTMIKLEQIARKEGLLALEAAVSAIVQERSGMEADICDEYSHQEFSGIERLLVVLARMLLSGYEPAQLEQVAVMRYYAAGFEGIEALCAGMSIVGFLSIQSGEHPMVLQDKLLALLPERIESWLLERKAEEREREREQMPKIPEQFFEDKNVAQSSVIDRMNAVILSMEDKSIERMIRDAESGTLALCLKAVTGSARKRIFDNLPDGLSDRLYKNMEYMGPVRLKDAEEAALMILSIIEKLRLAGEISLKEEVKEDGTENEE